MVKQWINRDQDSLLDDLIQTCHDLQDTSRRAVQGGGAVKVRGAVQASAAQESTAKGYCGPLRWQQSCDQAIAIPRKTLAFRLELNTTSTADFDDVFNVRLHRELPETLIFERITSVLVDGQPSRPTNHSLSRTLDVGFNRIVAGSVVVLTYEVRVRFDAEPSDVLLDDLNINWSWVSRSRKLVAHNKHLQLPAKHADHSAAGSSAAEKSLQPF